MRHRLRRSRRVVAVAIVVAVGLGSSACTGAFNPHARQASDIATLWWVLFAIACAVFLIVVGLTAYALWRRRGGPSSFERNPRTEAMFVLIGGAVIPLLILGAVFGLSLSVVHDSGSDRPNQLVVNITGHQWWYQVEYPQQHVTATNVLHIPEHSQVRLNLKSADVIHSFWVPELNGKVDLIPGITNTLYITDAAPGTYTGQCAEFCGIGHTQMKITVVVESEKAFQGWVAQQAAEAKNAS